MKKKVVIIDNYDSFTYILKQYCGQLNASPEVFFNDQITLQKLKKLKPTHLILSPGPGTVENPKDVGIMFEAIEYFYKKIPILGVCLGHQALGKFFGGKITRAPKIMHGKRSNVYHNGQGIFKHIPSPLTAMRYHSLIIDTPFYLTNPNVNVTAHTPDFEIMALAHQKYPIFGLQFHPESLGTQWGKKIIRNFLSA